MDISPHYDMNGTLQSQKYKSQHSSVSVLQSNALKETVKTIEHEFPFQNYTIDGKYDASCKDKVFFEVLSKNYDGRFLREHSAILSKLISREFCNY